MFFDTKSDNAVKTDGDGVSQAGFTALLQMYY